LKTSLENSIEYFADNPRKLFAIDAIGALVSGLMIALLIKNFEVYFGELGDKIFYLSIVPFLFFLYSGFHYFLNSQSWRHFLRFIAIANVIYCIVTFSLVFTTKLTSLGKFYFIGEILIILSLVYLELKVARQKN